jgi:DNA-binding NarL/FixJ family response regulator
MLNILIADDHELVRRGIGQILLEEFSLLKLDEVKDTSALLQTGLEANWDLIISDISMPGGGGIEAIPQILKKKPAQKILIISVYPAEQYIIQVLRAGAFGFLNKDTIPEELINAVKTIFSGHHYIHPALSEKMGSVIQEKIGLLPHDLLSYGERQVMRQLASGTPMHKITIKLNISSDTLHQYCRGIMDKTGATTENEITNYVSKTNL